MTDHRVTRSHAACTRRRFLAVAATAAGSTSLTGCLPNLLKRPPDFGPPLPPGCTQADLLTRVNDNARRLYSWRSTDVSISSNGMGGLPMSLAATIAVESPRNFRLMVSSSLTGEEADLGSNRERFWFWMRRGEPKHVFTATHDRIDRARHRLKIPFEPDWLMEVLGVIPIEENLMTLVPSADGPYHQLIADHLTPDGRTVRRVIDVDRNWGYVHRHSLFDQTSGQLIAQATLSKQQKHPIATGEIVVLPHEVRLDWPQAKMVLTLKIGDVDINPASLSSEMWRLPSMPEYPVFDLGA